MARPSRRVLLALAAILLLGLGLRLFNLGARSMWYDEGFSLGMASKAPASLTVFNPSVYDEPPMMGAVAAVGEKIAGLAGLTRGFWPYDACVKLPQVLFTMLSLIFAWASFRRLFRNENAALLGAALCAVSPFQVYYAQELRAYAPYICFSSALLYCSLRAVEDNRVRWWAGVSAAMILLPYTHFFSVWNIALFNCFFMGLVVAGRRDLFRPWMASQIVAFMLVLPALLQMHHVNAVFTHVTNIYTVLPTITHGFITFKTFLAGYTPRSMVYWPLFLLGAGLYLVGLWRLRARRTALALSVLLTVVPIFANILVWRMRTFPMYEHRLFIFSGLVACGLMGLGLTALRPRAAQWTAGVAVFALMMPCLADYYHQNLHPSMDHRMAVRHKVDVRGVAQYIIAHAQPGDVVGHASHFSQFPMRYYLEGKGIPQSTLRLTESELTGFLNALPNRTMWENLGSVPRMLPEVAAEGRRMWYVETWWEPWEIPTHVQNMRRWLEEHGRKIETRQFDGITVTLYELRNGAKQP
jgi:hypothetical protein